MNFKDKIQEIQGKERLQVQETNKGSERERKIETFRRANCRFIGSVPREITHYVHCRGATREAPVGCLLAEPELCFEPANRSRCMTE